MHHSRRQRRLVSKIHSIYQNAYFTLAATWSSGADDGCFSKPMSTKLSHVLHAAVDKPEIGNVYARRVLSHKAFSLLDNVSEDLPLWGRV